MYYWYYKKGKSTTTRTQVRPRDGASQRAPDACGGFVGAFPLKCFWTSPYRWTGQGVPDRFGGAGPVLWRRTGSVAPDRFGDTGPAPTKLAVWNRATRLSPAQCIELEFERRKCLFRFQTYPAVSRFLSAWVTNRLNTKRVWNQRESLETVQAM